MDKLNTIMSKQQAFQESLGTIFDNLTEEERADFIIKHSVYLDQEIQEALYEMPFFKAWKDYSGMDEDARAIAWQKVRMELVDALHFFINLCLAAGHTPETLYHMYMAKNKENYRRQEAGYTYEKLYRDQSVEDVMGMLASIEDTSPTCAVSIDGDIYFADDFVALLCKEDGRGTLFSNTDPVTLGVAAAIITSRYEEVLAEMPTEERTEVINAVLTVKECTNE